MDPPRHLGDSGTWLLAAHCRGVLATTDRTSGPRASACARRTDRERVQALRELFGKGGVDFAMPVDERLAVERLAHDDDLEVRLAALGHRVVARLPIILLAAHPVHTTKNAPR